jgi:hypothetical protein
LKVDCNGSVWNGVVLIVIFLINILCLIFLVYLSVWSFWCIFLFDPSVLYNFYVWCFMFYLYFMLDSLCWILCVVFFVFDSFCCRRTLPTTMQV